MAYDRQLICVLQHPSQQLFMANLSGAYALQEKAETQGLKSRVVTVVPGQVPTSRVTKQFAKLTNQSRLYIVGHGNQAADAINGLSPEQLAKLVVDSWGLTAVDKIVLIACKLGGAPGNFANSSFARSFHYHLAKDWLVYTRVAGYTNNVSVAAKNHLPFLKQVHNLNLTTGQKVFPKGGDTSKFSQPYLEQGSKVCWTWNLQKTQQLLVTEY